MSGGYAYVADGSGGLCILRYTGAQDQLPTRIIKLQKDGVEINSVNVGDLFDIYVGGSTDDTGIRAVRFSSDDVRDNVPTGKWTRWYDWDRSSEDWDAGAKIKHWS
ncbi:MAG: hypothetical protein ACUVWN_11990, partial [bacterium]